MVDVSVNIGGLKMPTFLATASGTFAYGFEYVGAVDYSKLGAVTAKGIRMEMWPGNPMPRHAEVPGGLVNAIGLQGTGVEHFLDITVPWYRSCVPSVPLIANIWGDSIESYARVAEKMGSAVDALEMNVSCPNVKAGGATWGVTCEGAASVTKAVRKATSKPLIVKLTPNVTSIADIAKAVEAEGADSISVINTLLGMRIDIRNRRPILHNNVGGLSGPAIFPVAVRCVWQCYNAVKIPIIGMGGISTWEDAVEMMLAGSSAIQMGTAIFTDPYAPLKVIDGLEKYMDDNGIKSLSEIVGQVKPW
jgi:dihydroorotate dehydrogenase (NAD+) catalytic subunit